MIRDAQARDAAAVCKIYNHYVVNTVVTFEEQPVAESDMWNLIREITRELPWLIFENEEGVILGYAFASRWKSRCAYRYAAEATIYLDRQATGQGIGTQLYLALIERLRAQSLHCVIGGIALPNPASVALHEKLNFEKVAQFKEVGWKMGRWIDVGYWELILSDTEPAG